jgi:hypothetical protein
MIIIIIIIIIIIEQQQQHTGGIGHKTCSLKTEGGLSFSIWLF